MRLLSMHRRLWLVVALMCLGVSWGISPFAHAQTSPPIRVAFFNPQGADDPFWKPVERFMRAAANDLNMEVTTYVADHSRQRMIEQVRTAVSATDKPDFIVFKNFKSNAPDILEIAEQHGVKSFMFNAGLTGAERAVHGGPRERYANWIGVMTPDDRLAGYTLASGLIRRARVMHLYDEQERIHMAGLTGNLSDSAAIERNLGLERALEENQDVEFHQLVPARWDRAQARQKATGLMNRYPELGVIWAANDPMGLGSVDAANDMGHRPGTTFLTGGIDWNIPALKAVRSGDMVMSIGGHFMEGGWVMVLLHDYAHGRDFATDGGSARRSEMAVLDQGNLDAYMDKFLDTDWGRVDFTVFSKVRSPEVETYDFSLDKILEQL